jgi:Xaa-Pro aminopeptidase
MTIDRRGLLALGSAAMMTGVSGAAWAGAAPNDAFPGFSDAEMAGRYARVRAEMARRGVDALVVYGHTGVGGSVGQVNLQYLARYAAVIETWLVVPLDGEPTMLLAIPYHIPNAQAISYVKDIRWGDALGNTIRRIRDLGLARGQLGLVGPGAVSHVGPTVFQEQWRRLASELPEATLSNATPWFDDLRLTKSDEEIALLRHAGALTDIAHEEVFAMTRAGVTPRELRRAMDVIAARSGATYPFGHIGATAMAEPQGFYPDFYPVDTPISPGSLVMTEFALGFGNYWAKIWGSYFVGEPTPEYRRLFETAAAVHDNLQKGLRPGLSGRDVNAFLEPITHAGFEQPANVLVGGWSALNHPPQMGALPSSLSEPFTRPFLDEKLQPRQSVTIQAWVSLPDTKKGLWVGSSGVITETGYESFNRYPVSRLRIAGGGEAAPSASFINVRGRVTELTSGRIAVQMATGETVRMRLTPDWSVQVMRPIPFGALETGRFVGAIERPQPDGTGRALEVHMFLPEVRFGAGSQPWDRPFGARMTQGELISARTTRTGFAFELAYGSERRRLVADKDLPVVLINNEGRDNIKIGVEVFILAWPEADGSLRVDAVATGVGGRAPPL